MYRYIRMKYLFLVVFAVVSAFPCAGRARASQPNPIPQRVPFLHTLQSTFIQSMHNSVPITFESYTFQSGLGAVVRSSHEKGMRALINKAKIDPSETSWIFLPEFELWINTAEKVLEASVIQNVKLMEFALDHTKTVEFWHTHVDAEYNNGYYTQEQMSYFGPSLYFIPTSQDVCSLMWNANFNPNNIISSFIASSQGILQMRADTLEWNLNNPYLQQAYNEYCHSEFNWIRELFRGSISTEHAALAESYHGALTLTFIKNVY